jgi:hypothetical protein
MSQRDRGVFIICCRPTDPSGQGVDRKPEIKFGWPKSSNKLASYFKWMADQSYLNNFIILNLLQKCQQTLLAALWAMLLYCMYSERYLDFPCNAK